MKSDKRKSGVAVAMRRRFPRKQVMTAKNQKRQKDARNSWRRDHEVG